MARHQGRGATIKPTVVDNICDLAEKLRAEADGVPACAFGRQLLRRRPRLGPWLQLFSLNAGFRLSLKTEAPLAVVPAVGRPTSDRINTIFDAISNHTSAGTPIWAIYDSRGIHDNWIKHLRWLDGHLPIKTVPVGELASALKGLLT